MKSALHHSVEYFAPFKAISTAFLDHGIKWVVLSYSNSSSGSTSSASAGASASAAAADNGNDGVDADTDSESVPERVPFVRSSNSNTTPAVVQKHVVSVYTSLIEKGIPAWADVVCAGAHSVSKDRDDEAMGNAVCLCPVITPAYLVDPDGAKRREWQTARRRGLHILPLCMDPELMRVHKLDEVLDSRRVKVEWEREQLKR